MAVLICMTRLAYRGKSQNILQLFPQVLDSLAAKRPEIFQYFPVRSF